MEPQRNRRYARLHTSCARWRPMRMANCGWEHAAEKKRAGYTRVLRLTTFKKLTLRRGRSVLSAEEMVRFGWERTGMAYSDSPVPGKFSVLHSMAQPEACVRITSIRSLSTAKAWSGLAQTEASAVSTRKRRELRVLAAAPKAILCARC